MLISGLCWHFPLVFVWVIGIFLAIGRWQRHPQVSAAILTSITCMLCATAGQLVVLMFVLPSPSVSMTDEVIYFQITAAAGSLIRAVGWVGMLVAIFGWRDPAGAGRSNPLQFSIRGLLVATFVVAVLCGLFRGLAALMGESAKMLLTLLDDIPVLICWLFGWWLAGNRRQRHPEVSRRVHFAIGLQLASLVVSIAIMVWLIASAYSPGIIMALSLIWLVTGPASWILLLAAAFGSRTTPEVAPGIPFRESPA